MDGADLLLEALQCGAAERSVSGQRAAEVKSLLTQGLQGRDNGIDFLRAQVATLAGVGVEGANRDSRWLDPEPREPLGLLHLPDHGLGEPLFDLVEIGDTFESVTGHLPESGCTERRRCLFDGSEQELFGDFGERSGAIGEKGVEHGALLEADPRLLEDPAGLDGVGHVILDQGGRISDFLARV